MRRFIDRLFTRQVACRNCPNYVVIDHRHTADGKPFTLGACQLEAPVITSYPRLTEAFPIRYPLEWCARHPLYMPKKGEGLYYAPGVIAADGGEELAGFNRAPTLAEAKKLAQIPKLSEQPVLFRQKVPSPNKAVNSDENKD